MKKCAVEDWSSPTDPDSRIAQMKDGRTHLTYKAEHVVDPKTDLVLAAEITPSDHGDTQSMADSVLQAQINLAQAGSEQEIEEVAADKGYHAAGWTDKPVELQRAVYGNRRRVRRGKGKKLQRRRSELAKPVG
jgi:transposase